MPLTNEDVLGEIEELHRRKPVYKNPAWQDMYDGKFTKAQSREVIRQNAIIPLHNHLYHGNLYIVCPDPKWREQIAEVTYEEATGRLYADGVPHYELYLRLAEAIGISREDMWNTPFCAGALAFRTYFTTMCSKSFLEGVSAHMLAGEAPVPSTAMSRAKALRQQFNLDDEALMFFTVHKRADEDHSGVGFKLLSSFATTEADKRLVIQTVSDTLDMMTLLFSDIYRHVKAM